MEDEYIVAMEEIGRQMAIRNRLSVANELFRMEHYDPDEYIDILLEIDEDLR